MSFYKYEDQHGDTGMIVGGTINPDNFRRTAELRDRPDEHLIEAELDELMSSTVIKEAVIGGLSHQQARRNELKVENEIGKGTGSLGF